jgi:hypothetical protein
MDVLDELLKRIEGESMEGDLPHLHLLADIVIQGTAVTSSFKSRVLALLYEKCLADNQVIGSFALEAGGLESEDIVESGRAFAVKLEELGSCGLKERTYSFLKRDLEGQSGDRRSWAIRHFSIRGDLIKAHIREFEHSVEPYIRNRDIRLLLLPLLGDMKQLAASILRTTDTESLIVPWYCPPVLPLYDRYCTGDQFAESACVLEKLSAGIFVYLPRLTIYAIAPDLGLDLVRDMIVSLSYAQAPMVERPQDWILDLEMALDRAWDRAWDPRFDHSTLVRYWAQDELYREKHRRTQSLVRDWAQSLARGRAYDAAEARGLDLDRVEAAIDNVALFHASMIHIATLLEPNENLLPHLAYALEKQSRPCDPYVRSAQLFRRLIRGEITREEELEFQGLLNIEDEKVRHIFDLAYLTDPQTRKPIFRFRSKL